MPFGGVQEDSEIDSAQCVKSFVIPSPFAVILSEAKNLRRAFAQGKLREESRSANATPLGTFATPSPGPPRPVKTPAAGHPLPQGGEG